MIYNQEIADAIEKMDFDETIDYVEKLDPKYSDGYASFIVEHVYGKENPNPEPLPDGLELY